MKNFRNMIMLACLAIFFAWYGGYWAYAKLYQEPRKRLGDELAKLKAEIETGKNNCAIWNQDYDRYNGFYARSMPRLPNEAQSLYTQWLLELLKYCNVETGDVRSDSPTRTTFGLNFRFNVQGSCDLDQLSRLLFEFYYASYLHRIVAMTLVPVDGKEGRMDFSLTIDAIRLQQPFEAAPYPLRDQLPSFYPYISRLQSNNLETYRIISERNLMQAAKGGVDKADYTYLTAINLVDGEPEIWLTDRSDDSITRAKKGERIRIGSFRATVLEIIGQEDVVFERGEGQPDLCWLVALGDCLNEAFALAPETVLKGQKEVEGPSVPGVD